jgi:hypothetical protein
MRNSASYIVSLPLSSDTLAEATHLPAVLYFLISCYLLYVRHDKRQNAQCRRTIRLQTPTQKIDRQRDAKI